MSLFLNKDCKVPAYCSIPLHAYVIVLKYVLILHDGNFITLVDYFNMLAYRESKNLRL